MQRYKCVTTLDTELNHQWGRMVEDLNGEYVKYDDIKLLDDSIKLMIVNIDRKNINESQAEGAARMISEMHLPFATIIATDGIEFSAITEDQLKDVGLQRIPKEK